MSNPVQLNITLTTTGNPVVVIPIPAALQAMDSGQQANQQTGSSAVDQLVRAIFRAGCFTDGKGTWYSSHVIQSITAQ